jgi:hypothetical protein
MRSNRQQVHSKDERHEEKQEAAKMALARFSAGDFGGTAARTSFG